MRPYPAELLRSLRHSLREVVIPAIEEPWPRYVAKAMEKLLEHLELRALHEERLLAEDITELDEVLGALAESFAHAPLASSVALSAWRSLPPPASGAGAPGHGGESGAGVGQVQGLQALNDGNEARRAHLVAAIEAMDVANATMGLGPRSPRAVRLCALISGANSTATCCLRARPLCPSAHRSAGPRR